MLNVFYNFLMYGNIGTKNGNQKILTYLDLYVIIYDLIIFTTYLCVCMSVCLIIQKLVYLS